MDGSCHGSRCKLFRFLGPAFVSLLSVFLISCQKPAARQNNITSSNITSLVPPTSGLENDPNKFEWQPIVSRGEEIIAIGNKKLPLPLRLPKVLVPIGHQALVWHQPQKGRLLFSLYFPPQKEAMLRNWISQFPSHLPLANGSYSSNSLHMKTYNDSRNPHVWNSRQSVHFGSGSVSFLFQPDHLMSKYERTQLSGDDELSKLETDLNSAYTLTSSPLKHQQTFIGMLVSFFPKAIGKWVVVKWRQFSKSDDRDIISQSA